MNKFLILCYISCVLFNNIAARTIRDLSLGYSYNPSQTSAGGSNVLTAPAPAPVISSLPGSVISSLPAPVISSPPNTINFNPGPSFQADSAAGSVSSQQTSIVPEGDGYDYTAPVVTKHFYIHTAPEDHDEQEVVRHINIGAPTQNYRVVFIKAPSSSASRAKIIANVAPTEEKTAIYVLAKKSNALDVSAEVVTQAPAQHKPEVFFVKYKTPAEAEHAQHVIQAQYDKLGGSSDVSDEGTINVTSVVGSLGETNAGRDYLPPHRA